MFQNYYHFGNPYAPNARHTLEQPRKASEYDKNMLKASNPQTTPIPDGLEPTVTQGASLFGYVATASREAALPASTYNANYLIGTRIINPSTNAMTPSLQRKQFLDMIGTPVEASVLGTAAGTAAATPDILVVLKALSKITTTEAEFKPLYQAYVALQAISAQRALTAAETEQLNQIRYKVKQALEKKEVTDLLATPTPTPTPTPAPTPAPALNMNKKQMAKFYGTWRPATEAEWKDAADRVIPVGNIQAGQRLIAQVLSYIASSDPDLYQKAKEGLLTKDDLASLQPPTP